MDVAGAAQIRSVGIDIGTATTQVTFSLLQVADTSAGFSAPRADIVSKQVFYRGSVHRTPLAAPDLIDGGAVRAIVEEEYRRAGVTPREIHTGAVVVTGETACKRNAGIVLRELSGLAGDFVVYTAGPDLESVIAGKGSGAARWSREHGRTAINLDIGGGTANLAAFCCGEPVACGCLNIGGRLIRLEGGRLEYISPAAGLVARDQNIILSAGAQVNPGELERIAARMNGVLEEVLGFTPRTPLADALATSGSASFRLEGPIDRLCFSGGVADCMASEGDPFRYGDIGVLLGRAVARGLATRAPLLNARETIRATVIGAGAHTMTVSGSTINCAEEALPRRNLPVLRLTAAEEEALYGGDGAALLEGRVRWFLGQSGGDNLALCLRGKRNPGYEEIRALAAAVAAGVGGGLPPKEPLIVTVERDMAKALGQQMSWRLEGARPVVCIDGIQAGNGDYLDLGKPLLGGLTVPVVVKTLLFGGEVT